VWSSTNILPKPAPTNIFLLCSIDSSLVYFVMAEGNLHVVAMPRWSSFLGVARLIIALVILILVATAAGIWYSANYAAFGLTLFTVSCVQTIHQEITDELQASATLIIFGYYSVSLCKKPELYNAWAILGLEIFGVIFWLVSFALCADWTATFNHDIYLGSGTKTNYGFWNAPFTPEDIGLESRDLAKRATNKWKASIGLMGTAAGLGAVEL
jgi:hypothetical protein